MQLSLILGVMTLGFADDPAAQGLLKELEGTYKVASMEANGVATPAEFLDLIQKVVIKDGVMSFHEGKDGKAAPRTARLTVVAVLKGTPSQAQVDIAPIDDAKKDQKYPAIVKVTKDGIVFCWPEREDSVRPSEYVSTQSNKQTLLTLKRARE